MKRSQAILRMPVDMVDAVMVLHDGDRSDVLLFVPPSEDIARVISEGSAFLPVMRDAAICFVARQAIACVGVTPDLAPKLDEDFPSEQEQVKVTLRSGMVLEGYLRWIAPPGMRRTADHLNSDVTQFVLHATDRAWIISKAHVVMVREQ